MGKKHAPLQLGGHPHLHHIEWIAQRLGWILWAVILFAALFGYLGPGRKTSQRASDGSIAVQYDRAIRFEVPTTIVVEIHHSPSPDSAKNLRLRLDQRYLDSVQVQGIVPDPIRSTLDDGGNVLEFRSEPNSSKSIVAFEIEPDTLGTISGAIALEGAEPVTIRQFVFP